MTTLQIVFLSVGGGLAYVALAIVTGATIAAEFVKHNRSKRVKELSEEQCMAIVIGGIVWIVGGSFVLAYKLTKKLTSENKKKCLICGVMNDPDGAHCKHCGQMFNVEL
jgi:hypothetical protein